MTISANGGYGIEIVGSAHDNVVFHTYIGTNAEGTANLGNALGGIALGPGTSSTTSAAGVALAEQDPRQRRPGRDHPIVRGNVVLGNAISGNAGDGVAGSSGPGRTTIGGNHTGGGSQLAAGQGNRIIINQGYGLYALGGCNGSIVQGNTISANGQGNVNLTNSRGITYIPT